MKPSPEDLSRKSYGEYEFWFEKMRTKRSAALLREYLQYAIKLADTAAAGERAIVWIVAGEATHEEYVEARDEFLAAAEHPRLTLKIRAGAVISGDEDRRSVLIETVKASPTAELFIGPIRERDHWKIVHMNGGPELYPQLMQVEAPHEPVPDHCFKTTIDRQGYCFGLEGCPAEPSHAETFDKLTALKSEIFLNSQAIDANRYIHGVSALPAILTDDEILKAKSRLAGHGLAYDYATAGDIVRAAELEQTLGRIFEPSSKYALANWDVPSEVAKSSEGLEETQRWLSNPPEGILRENEGKYIAARNCRIIAAAVNYDDLLHQLSEEDLSNSLILCLSSRIQSSDEYSAPFKVGGIK